MELNRQEVSSQFAMVVCMEWADGYSVHLTSADAFAFMVERYKKERQKQSPLTPSYNLPHNVLVYPEVYRDLVKSKNEDQKGLMFSEEKRNQMAKIENCPDFLVGIVKIDRSAHRSESNNEKQKNANPEAGMI